MNFLAAYAVDKRQSNTIDLRAQESLVKTTLSHNLTFSKFAVSIPLRLRGRLDRQRESHLDNLRMS